MNAVVNETEATETKIVREKRTNWEFDDAANTMSIVELRRMWMFGGQSKVRREHRQLQLLRLGHLQALVDPAT